MANGFTQNHELIDLLANKNFESVLPQFRVKQTHEGTKVSVTSKSLYKMVLQYAKNGARGHYKPLKATMGGMVITICGTLITTLDEAYNSVYESIKANTTMLNMIANNRDILRSALKYSETRELKGLAKPRLYLKEGVYINIYNVSPQKKLQFIQEVLDNVRYSDQFEKVQKQFKLNEARDYEINKYKWQMKVGETVWARPRGQEFTDWNRENFE